MRVDFKHSIPKKVTIWGNKCFNLMMGIILQWICILNHHVSYSKCYNFVDYISVKQEWGEWKWDVLPVRQK